ncbi:MAG: hypothetical protein WD981_02145 [Gaiellaceae bacterium]
MEKNANTSRRVVLASVVAVLVSVALAFAASAVGGGADHSVAVAKLKGQIATLKLQVKASRAEVNFVAVSSRIAFIEAAGMHAMESKYNTTGLTERDIGTIQNVLTVVSKLGWPGALKTDAAAMISNCQAFLDSWRAGDKAGAFPKLQAAHTAYHALVASGYAWLATQSS